MSADVGTELLAAWWRFLPGAALQGAIAILVVAAIDRMLPRRAPAELREALWTLALCRLVLPPGLASPFGIAARVAPAWAVGPVAPLPAGGPPVWVFVLVAAWAVGTIAVATTLAVKGLRLGARLRSLRRDPRPADLAALARATNRLAHRRRVALFRLPGSGSPFVIGALRPAIYLPDGLRDDELEPVLLHELAHVRRLDPLRRAAALSVHCLHWFHPLVPLARRRLADLAEPCSDRIVRRALRGDTEPYRRTLLEAARRLVEEPAGIALLGAPSMMRLRMEVLVERDRPLRRRLLTGIAALVLGLAVLPMAARADGGANAVAEWIERPPGCLKLRYLVLKRLAETSTDAASSQTHP
ncbi:MAG: M56 family metallopeptidase [Acidobacteriota bacterium]